jgi:uncharacterized protein
MKVFITGGSGFVGSFLTKKLTENGHHVTILTRSSSPDLRLPQGASLLTGDPTRTGPWQQLVPEHDAVINLAGASIFQRWSKEVKRDLVDSRILTTANVVHALAGRKGKEMHFLSTSAVGYYGFHGDEELSESDPPGSDFLSRLACSWEASALRAKETGARVAICRFGVVMGKRGGALANLATIFNRYLGAPLGNGRQWLSWIHEQDLAGIFLFLLEHKDFEGPVNCTAPYPLRNRELTKCLGQALRKPVIFPPVPAFMLRIVLGEFANVLLKGQKVLPRTLLAMGYRFRFPTLHEALDDLLQVKAS